MLSLTSSLSDLGFASADMTALSEHAATVPERGVRARLAQLRFGVDKKIITPEEARTLLIDQPWFMDLEFRTAYEDDNIVAVSKPWDVQLRHDDKGERWAGEQTLRSYLEENHPTVFTDDGEVRLCHQLDFATSGVIVTAKSSAAADAVARCFRERTSRKLYAALVFGHVPWSATQWDDRIMPSKRRFKQRISSGGKSAVTNAHLGARGTLRLGSEHRGRDASLLWLEPHTGRRHQLRLHCSHHDHGIVGDLTYSDDRLAYRTFLHAAALELPLRFKGDDDDAPAQMVRIEAPLAPAGWAHAFEAHEQVSMPEGWEGTALL